MIHRAVLDEDASQQFQDQLDKGMNLEGILLLENHLLVCHSNIRQGSILFFQKNVQQLRRAPIIPERVLFLIL